MKKMKRIIFTSMVLFFMSFNLHAQDPVDYSVRISQLSSVDTDACSEPFNNEYVYNVSVRDNINADVSGPSCFTCDAGGDCTVNLSTVIRTQSSSSATSIIVNLQGMEDDSFSANCSADIGDDCICGPSDVATINFRNGTEGQWNAYGPFNCGAHAVVFEIFHTVLVEAPVELVVFEGKAEKKSNKLNWSTATEQNSDYFEVQRSKNGRDWQVLNQVTAKGFSDEVVEYNFEDFNYLKETYYRLRMVDFDGSQEYSEIIVINNDHLNDAEVITAVYPNPSKDEFTVQFNDVIKGEEIDLMVVDALGKVIRSYAVNIDDLNDYAYRIDLGNEASGLYFLTVQTSSGVVSSSKLFLQDRKL